MLASSSVVTCWASRLLIAVCSSISSSTWLPIVMTGFRAEAGILEDQRDLPSPDVSHLFIGHLKEVSSPPYMYLSGNDLTRIRYELQNRESGHGLTGPALSNYAENAVLVQRQRDAIDGLDYAFVGREVGVEIIDFEYWCHWAWYSDF